MRLLFFSLITIIFIIFPKTTLAHLGGDIDGIPKDIDSLGAKMKVDTKGRFTVFTLLTTPNTIKEYLWEGKVAAVSWVGAVRPNFEVILGPSFSLYRKLISQKSNKKNKRHARHQTETLVFEQSGHMGHLTGYAYLRDLVPTDFNVNEL